MQTLYLLYYFNQHTRAAAELHSIWFNGNQALEQMRRLNSELNTIDESYFVQPFEAADSAEELIHAKSL